eukprot:TRINITY_DN15395_c0_g2_i1.p1 TRINITY_DN15395_c0_g2~~TRINITY_DN15395_c0_g2_i1.p1  ORF type:complete len:563 (-),score=69.81 TRINITY_DN15395_c0_g2_i1:125-1750(-)
MVRGSALALAFMQLAFVARRCAGVQLLSKKHKERQGIAATGDFPEIHLKQGALDVAENTWTSLRGIFTFGGEENVSGSGDESTNTSYLVRIIAAGPVGSRDRNLQFRGSGGMTGFHDSIGGFTEPLPSGYLQGTPAQLRELVNSMEVRMEPAARESTNNSTVRLVMMFVSAAEKRLTRGPEAILELRPYCPDVPVALLSATLRGASSSESREFLLVLDLQFDGPLRKFYRRYPSVADVFSPSVAEALGNSRVRYIDEATGLLSLSPGSGVNISIGDDIKLKQNSSVKRCIDGQSATGSVTLRAARDRTAPTAPKILKWSTKAGSKGYRPHWDSELDFCEDMNVYVTYTTPSLGNTYRWEVFIYGPSAKAAEVNATKAFVATQTGASIRIPNAMVIPGYAHFFYVVAFNTLSKLESEQVRTGHLVMKQSSAPTMKLYSWDMMSRSSSRRRWWNKRSTIVLSYGMIVSLRHKVTVPSCVPSDNDGYEIQWVLDPPVPDFECTSEDFRIEYDKRLNRSTTYKVTGFVRGKWSQDNSSVTYTFAT